MRPLRMISCCLALAAAAGAGPGRAAAPPRPSWKPRSLSITPNAIESRDVPMSVEAAGEAGATAWLFVLRDCNGDQRPDVKGTRSCRSPVESWTGQFDARGNLKEKVDLRRHPDIPTNVPLWLSVCSGATPETGCADAFFGLADNPCTLFESLLHAFTGGLCDPKLHRMLARRRGGTAGAGRFEVRTVDPRATPPGSTSVPGTSGATGVAWQGTSTLLVTIGPSRPGRRDEPDGGAAARPALEPGLYRMAEDGGDRTCLWRAPAGVTPAAPVSLGEGRIAFVTQPSAPGATPAASLIVWDRKVIRQMPLDRPIRRLYGSRAGAKALLAWAADDSGFLHLDLDAGKATALGFSGIFPYLLQRSPTGDVSAVDYEDVANDNGWELALIDGEGRGVAEIAVGPGDALAPAWRPDGGRLAFLFEVDR